MALLITVVYDGFIYIFGGFNKTFDVFYNDLHRYDPVNSTWLEINPLGKSPRPRRRHICVLIEDRVYISGGSSYIDPKKASVSSKPLDLNFTVFTDASMIVNNIENTDDIMELDDLHILSLGMIFVIIIII